MESNHSIIRSIIWTLCLLAVIAVTTVCVMSFKGLTIPPELNTIAGGLIGTIGGMLVKTTPTSSAPTQTKIVNSEKDPVNTTDVKS